MPSISLIIANLMSTARASNLGLRQMQGRESMMGQLNSPGFGGASYAQGKSTELGLASTNVAQYANSVMQDSTRQRLNQEFEREAEQARSWYG